MTHSFFLSARRRNILWKAFGFCLVLYMLCNGIGVVMRFLQPHPSFALPPGVSIDDAIRGDFKRNAGPILYFPPTCHPHHNVAFIKCMKCATETVGNILRRYALSNDLSVVLPVDKKIYLGWPFSIVESDFRPSSRGYNMLIEHAVYNGSYMREVMNANTQFITIIREPLDMFFSTLHYFNVFNIIEIEGPRKGPVAVRNYLHNIQHYESLYKSHEYSKLRYCIPDGFSVTKNLLGHCLGMPLGFPDKDKNITRDRNAVKKYIETLDSDFMLVMLMEYLDESLVLLKRMMCWQIKDIIYHSTNKGNYSHKRTDSFGPYDKKLHQSWSSIDYQIYDHFNRTFWKKVAQQSSDFHFEVTFFKKIQEHVAWFCSSVTPYGRSYIRFPESRWSPAFTFTSDDCELMGDNLLVKLKEVYNKTQIRENVKSKRRTDHTHHPPVC